VEALVPLEKIKAELEEYCEFLREMRFETAG